MNNKKAQVTWIVLLVLALLILIFLPISFGITAFFLSKNVFSLLGTFLVVMGIIGLLWLGVPKQITLVLIVIGVLLVLTPVLIKSTAGITLQMMMT